MESNLEFGTDNLELQKLCRSIIHNYVNDANKKIVDIADDTQLDCDEVGAIAQLLKIGYKINIDINKGIFTIDHKNLDDTMINNYHNHKGCRERRHSCGKCFYTYSEPMDKDSFFIIGYMTNQPNNCRNYENYIEMTERFYDISPYTLEELKETVIKYNLYNTRLYRVLKDFDIYFSDHESESEVDDYE
jgi:hypothetical protein